MIDHVGSRLVNGDVSGTSITDALMRLRFDPGLAGLWTALARAGQGAAQLPRGARASWRAIDPQALVAPARRAVRRSAAHGGGAAARRPGRGIGVVVLGHTHAVGGSVEAIRAQDRSGCYANTGSWIAAASVADLRARGVGLGAS